jgi:hypothetical protein
MTATDSVLAPLEANDPRRARALKAKIRDRVSDVRRHLLALRTAVRTPGGRVVSRAPASKRYGFHLNLAPGRYVLHAVVIDKTPSGPREAEACPRVRKVRLRAGTNAPVRLFVDCNVP